MEEWREIEGFPNYQVSNLGRVKSLNYGRTRQGRILKYSLSTWGYPTVSLCRDKQKYMRTIHRLVAEAFLDNPNGLPCVDHINRNRLDNHLGNLRWVSYSLNCSNRVPEGTNTGHQHICLNNKGYYQIALNRNKKKYSTMKATLEKAIAWRDATLNSLEEEKTDE